MSLAWLFPGQGTQAVGMGRDLYEGSAAACSLLDLADTTLGFKLTRLIFDGPADELQLTINAQPAIVAVSLASLAAFEEVWRHEVGESPPQPAFVAGHSVGEYAALAASGATDASGSLRLVRARAEAMHASGNNRPGSMAAILGLTRDAVEQACRAARDEVPGSYVAVANHNSDTQVSIAGDQEGLEAAMRLCKTAGARRCMPLAVSAAFHSVAMAEAAGPVRHAVSRAVLHDAVVPLVANVTAQPVQAAGDLGDELVEQVASPVLWADSMRTMLNAGVSAFVEFGSGKVLTNIAQRMDEKPDATSAGDAMESVRQAVAWVREGSDRGGS